ncbi:hypothetical protein PNP85_15550 [Halobacterium salinarum]|jgi:hypothetical protein|nr:hypothetical protein [Halobacterium salinarum]MDL0137857.1 hypothetical protein [Halobacterium salinarum]MDL0140909.1 hypothetical protein [Halobacterium salinarum]
MLDRELPTNQSWICVLKIHSDDERREAVASAAIAADSDGVATDRQGVLDY